MVALTPKGPHATCNFDVPGENREMKLCLRTEITEGPQHLSTGREPAIFHVAIDDRNSTTLACWISWSSPNLIPRVTRDMVHWHPCNETYQSGNNGCFSRHSDGPTGH
ncbi:unnamed protein product [Clavelina lepadiformis]|uniref:Uncharacterized protein n=1 Tax=Clavelina lepadiformis TaxID=159417 RepID=A0ABP0GGY8_CLALP